MVQIVSDREPASHEERILEALFRIGQATRKQRTDGFDLGSLWILTLVDKGGQPRLNELAQASELDISTVSRHVRNLEQQDLLRRTPDPCDGRAQLIALTPTGTGLLERARAERKALLTQRLATWDPSDVAALDRLISRLAAEIATSSDDLPQESHGH